MSRKLPALLLARLMLPFSAMNVAAVGEPDLWINEISFSDDSPTGGDTVTITAEVANDGGESGVVSVPPNVTFDWDGNYIGTDRIRKNWMPSCKNRKGFWNASCCMERKFEFESCKRTWRVTHEQRRFN